MVAGGEERGRARGRDGEGEGEGVGGDDGDGDGDGESVQLDREHGGRRRGGGRGRGIHTGKQQEERLTVFEQLIAVFEAQGPHAAGASLRSEAVEA